MNQIKTALVSVSDKSNLNILADFFKKNNIKVVSTSATFNALKKLGVNTVQVCDQTGFPEVMGGRVKTLHPRIHMALLARAESKQDSQILKENSIQPFDLLVVNLYPFSKKKEEGVTGNDLVEFIDVGGPSMIRAGAKNFLRVVTLTSPKDYGLLEKGETQSLETRKNLAAKAFKHLSEYDGEVFSWLLNEDKQPKKLRYGENPHQEGVWLFDQGKEGLHQATILQGKELSLNNLLDLTTAVESLALFEKPTVVSVKHNNPCGIGSGQNIEEALQKSLNADPMSVFGGIVAMNKELDASCAEKLVGIFLECIIAPLISKEAKTIFATKKNLRVLEWPLLSKGYRPEKDQKRISGGIVEQTVGCVHRAFSKWEQVTGQTPEAKVIKALEFSWKVVRRLKSNAISICGEDLTLGLGMGQVNRIDAVKSAIQRWKVFHKTYEGPVVLASDAFFPFPDSIQLIAKAGIKWVVQPGGSIKDKTVIQKAKDLGLGMFFTGERYFLH